MRSSCGQDRPIALRMETVKDVQAPGPLAAAATLAPPTDPGTELRLALATPTAVRDTRDRSVSARSTRDDRRRCPWCRARLGRRIPARQEHHDADRTCARRDVGGDHRPRSTARGDGWREQPSSGRRRSRRRTAARLADRHRSGSSPCSPMPESTSARCGTSCRPTFGCSPIADRSPLHRSDGTTVPDECPDVQDPGHRAVRRRQDLADPVGLADGGRVDRRRHVR